MAYSIEFTPAAARQLRDLPQAGQTRIAKRIDQLLPDPHQPGSKKLCASEDLYRIRAGDYRIIYQI